MEQPNIETNRRGEDSSGDTEAGGIHSSKGYGVCPDCGESTVNGQGVEVCLECGWETGRKLSADGGVVVQPTGTVPTELDGAVCLVTGSSRGIGRAIAERLGEAGAHTVVNYCNSEDMAYEVRDTVEARRGSASVVRADVSDTDDVERMASEIHREVGSVDVVINNAGVNADSTFENLDPDEWQKVVSVNLDGAYYVTNAFFDDIKSSDNGRLINISSIVGRRGNFGQANYAASKSGLEGFTKTLSLELAPHGATANCVAPGFTKTSMIEDIPESVKQDILDRVPLNRFADPEEVAEAVAFLASPRASYVTGEVLGVDGGMAR